jgi:heat shock protein HspQ
MIAPLLCLVFAQGGTRTDVAGWIYLKVHGTPYEVGYQAATLAADEVDDDIKACAAQTKIESGKDWNYLRQTSHRLFWAKLDPEVKEELRGLAEGVTAKGHPHDVDDLLAYNAYIEVSEYYLPYERAHGVASRIAPTTKLACSAFVATGSATADGKPVMGHNFWWDYIMGSRWNVILDVTPAKGHRFMLDAPAGFIHSGSDFAINDAGMMLCETTISGFHGFDPQGIPEFVRMRKAIQYGDSLNNMVTIFKTGNNGGYANTWLMADTKTGEIGKLELGLKNAIYSHKADGYYVGSNFAEDPKLTKEETNYVASPGNNCEVRKETWYHLLDAEKGKVDYRLAENFLANGQLCAGALNAKVATADSIAKMEFWARMGFPTGRTLDIPAMVGPNSPVTPYAHVLKGEKWAKFPPQ